MRNPEPDKQMKNITAANSFVFSLFYPETIQSRKTICLAQWIINKIVSLSKNFFSRTFPFFAIKNTAW